MKSTQVTVQMERGLYLGNMKFKMGVEEQWGLLLAVRRPELGEFSFIIINKEVFFFCFFFFGHTMQHVES